MPTLRFSGGIVNLGVARHLPVFISPSLIGIRPARACKIVLLPQPVGPTSIRISFSPSEKFKSLTTRLLP